MPSPTLSIAVGLAVIVSFLGWRTRALTGTGAVAASLTGSVIVYGTGWAGGAALGVFFVGASLVSWMTEGRTLVRLEARGNRRDLVQVMANGGGALAGGVLALQEPTLGLWVVTCSLAAAGADTYATSFGALSRRDPVLLGSGRRVMPGTSGAVSLAGTAGGVLGAALPAGAAAITVGDTSLLAGAAAIGFAGMLLDSLIGATLQARFHCRRCDVPTELRVHRCGVSAEHLGGLHWINNDVVNAIATILAGLTGLLVGFLLRGFSS
jgi:uncharacterized protein (TIGR00297 family)